jgi:glycosyltransferase involved in cell wall biosynthesis
MSSQDGSPLVTYAVMSYRHAPFIRDAVRAALAQTYSPLEVLIVDDCSPDSSFDIIRDEVSGYSGPHQVTTRRNRTRLGLFGNAHQLYQEFRGEFLVLADGDDVSYPTRTEQMVRAWQQTGASIVTCNAIFVDSSVTRSPRYWQSPDMDHDVSLEHLALNGSSACTFGPGMGLERRIVDEFGLVPTGYDSGDLILAFWGGLLGGCHFIREPLLEYRVHDGNGSIGRAVDRLDGTERLIMEERQWYTHMAIAFYEVEQIEAFIDRHPDRAELRQVIAPLLYEQAIRHARSLVQVRGVLDAQGLRYIGGEKGESPMMSGV